MSVFFTSDTHFGHANVIKYCNRPFKSSEEMDEALIENWNSVVSPGDTVYHLGDFGFGRADFLSRILWRLNGNKSLVLGNHDKTIKNQVGLFLKDGLLREVVPYKEISVNKQHIVLCHYAMRVWNKSHYGSWMLYGHSHGTLPPHGKSVDVGTDSKWVLGSPKYAPLSFDEIQRFMNGRTVDHHEDRR